MHRRESSAAWRGRPPAPEYAGSRPGVRWKRTYGGGALLIALLLAAPLFPRNGEVLKVSEVLSGKDTVDLTFDGSDGTFWVLGANGSTSEAHRIYHVSLDLTTLLGSIDNPHPPGSIASNDLTTNRGIAYRSLSRTLFVLSSVGPRLSQEFLLEEIQRDGTKVLPAPVTVAPPDEDASLFGLAYDVLARQFWTLDIQNDKAIRFAPDGTPTRVLTLPGKTAPEVVLRGSGIAFALEGIEPRIYVAYGDIFTAGPAKILQLSTEGELVGDVTFAVPTGVAIPLREVPSDDRRGFEVYRIGALRRVGLIAAGDRLVEIEHTVSSPLPPSGLSCALTTTNQVALSWRNHGSGPSGIYEGMIQVLRNGVPVATLPGDASTFTDETPVEGTSTYSLRSAETPDGPFSAESCPCEVTVGPGGLIAWTPVPLSTLHDTAVDSRSGEVFVTDNVLGRILVYAPDLTLAGELTSPWPNPGGIAFVPAIRLGFPEQEFENLLAVAEAAGNRLRLIDPADPARPPVTTITLRFEEGVTSPRIGGLAYIPSQSLFIATETSQSPPRLYAFERDGRLALSCVPPDFLILSTLEGPITYDAIQDTVLAVFEDGLVRELFVGPTCPPTGFEFALGGLRNISLQPGFAGGIEIDGNTLLVSGKTTQALFRTLIFPFSPPFIRGDFDTNSSVDLTDAIALAGYLFQRGPPPACLDAADVNDDGVLDVADPVHLLFFLFVAGSPPPPPPYPDPGSDPTFRDNLGCGK